MLTTKTQRTQSSTKKIHSDWYLPYGGRHNIRVESALSGFTLSVARLFGSSVLRSVLSPRPPVPSSPRLLSPAAPRRHRDRRQSRAPRRRSLPAREEHPGETSAPELSHRGWC